MVTSKLTALHRDQLRAQRSVTNMGELPYYAMTKAGILRICEIFNDVNASISLPSGSMKCGRICSQ